MEHHSNLVPWQMLCAERQARLRVVPVTATGELRLDELDAALGPRTRILAVAHVANAIGTVNPVAAIVERAHARGVPVLVDGAQAAAHLPIDVQALGCDFYAFSAHKMYGPTGIGVLYGRGERLAAMAPFLGGGEMVRSVSLAEGPRWAAVPHKFEAGTPNIEGAVGLGGGDRLSRSAGIARRSRRTSARWPPTPPRASPRCRARASSGSRRTARRSCRS